MWKGLTGNRLKNGTKGLLIGVIVSSILLFGSFYIYFLYLLIPVILVIIFHYTKTWRYTDRSFYGFLTIVIAFFIAVSGISYTLINAPSHSDVIYQIDSLSYDIHFNYTNINNDYLVYFSIPANNISSNANISLISLFTGGIFSNYTVTMIKNGSYYYASENLGHLSNNAYVLNFTFYTTNISTNISIKHSVEFLGPVLVPLYVIILEFGKTLLITYLIITYIFFLIFAYFARMISNARKRAPKNNEIKDETKSETETKENEYKGN
ncbi:MAG: hypothetical protein ACP5MU_02150 [Thermoplasmata archaeon]